MSAKKQVAINGFGRIGRAFFRHYCELLYQGYELPFEVVAINDCGDPAVLTHLLEYDTHHGRAGTHVMELLSAVSMSGHSDVIDNHWRDLGVDILLECSGQYRNRAALSRQIDLGGVERVMLAAPAYDALDHMVVYGVNHDQLLPAHRMISNASCTTNALAVVLTPLLKQCQIEQLWVTEVHGYTRDQTLLDHAHRDPRRARSAAHNMIPTQTKGLNIIGDILPELQGRVQGYSMRVPLPVGACLDITITLKKCAYAKAPTIEEVNTLFADHQSDLLGYNDQPLVSSDFIGRTESVIFDATQTRLMGDQLKILAWFDNEWGYSRRLLDLLLFVFSTASK